MFFFQKKSCAFPFEILLDQTRLAGNMLVQNSDAVSSHFVFGQQPVSNISCTDVRPVPKSEECEREDQIWIASVVYECCLCVSLHNCRPQRATITDTVRPWELVTGFTCSVEELKHSVVLNKMRVLQSYRVVIFMALRLNITAIVLQQSCYAKSLNSKSVI